MTQSGRCTGYAGAGLLLVLAGVACAELEGPSEWGDQDVQLSVHYDTVPGGVTGDSLPLQVQYDTTRNAVGYPILWATVTAENLGDRALVGVMAPCGWRFRAYQSEERAGNPVWGEGGPEICMSIAYAINLPPGAVQTFPRRSLPLNSIIAGGGPGRYYLTARLWGGVGEGPGRDKWLTDWIPAGSIEVVPIEIVP